MQRLGDYKRCSRIGSRLEPKVNYYAHTAVRADGKPELDTAKWQLLPISLLSVCS